MAPGIAIGSAGFPHCVLSVLWFIDLRHSRLKRKFSPLTCNPLADSWPQNALARCFLDFFGDVLYGLHTVGSICCQLLLESISGESQVAAASRGTVYKQTPDQPPQAAGMLASDSKWNQQYAIRTIRPRKSQKNVARERFEATKLREGCT